MKGVNMVIVEEKYFWKMYQFSSTKSSVIGNANNNFNTQNSIPGVPLTQTVMQSNQTKNSINLSQKEMNESSWVPRSPKSAARSSIR